jgi:hypothetical protein
MHFLRKTEPACNTPASSSSIFIPSSPCLLNVLPTLGQVFPPQLLFHMSIISGNTLSDASRGVLYNSPSISQPNQFDNQVCHHTYYPNKKRKKKQRLNLLRKEEKTETGEVHAKTGRD